MKSESIFNFEYEKDYVNNSIFLLCLMLLKKPKLKVSEMAYFEMNKEFLKRFFIHDMYIVKAILESFCIFFEFIFFAIFIKKFFSLNNS